MFRRLNTGITNLSKSSATRAVAVLFAGQITSQAVLFCSTPLLTRLYSPQQLGAATAMLAAAALLAPLASGTFEQAIVLARTRLEAINLVWLVMVLAIAVGSTLSLVGEMAVLLTPDSSALLDDWEPLRWAPLCATLTCVSSGMVYFATREKRYRSVALGSAAKGSLTSLGQVVVGVASPSTTGLLAITALGQGGSSVGVLGGFRSAIRGSRTRRRDLVKVARAYSRFPRHTLPATLLSAATLNTLPLLIGLIYGGSVLGVWGLSQRLVAVPLVLVAQSVASVYYQRASTVRDDPKALLRLFDSVVIRVSIGTMPVFIVLAALAQGGVAIFLGPSWSEAGIYVAVMAPWLWIRLAASVVSQTPAVMARNGVSVVAQAILLITQVVVAVLGISLHWDFLTFLMVLSASMSLAYASLIVVFRRTIKGVRAAESG